MKALSKAKSVHEISKDLNLELDLLIDKIKRPKLDDN